MNILSFAMNGLNHKLLHTVLSVIATAMGITMLVSVYLISTGIRDGLQKSCAKIDIVAGAKGSPLQLILSSIYHTDAPIGNIDMDDFEMIEHHPMVSKAIPIVVGDNFKGWRIVGTTEDFFSLYDAKMKEGREFSKPFEVVAGASTGVHIDEEFAARHGVESEEDDIHDSHLYKVVGKLSPTGTVIDRLLLTPFKSVQDLHAHAHEHKEENHHDDESETMGHQITAILIKARSGAAVMNLPRIINQSERMQAASPAYELTRLSKSFGVGRDVLNCLGGAILALSGFMLFSTLATSLADRRYDMAVLRVMGASPAKLFTLLITEGVLVAGMGALIGILLGHSLAYFLSGLLGSFEGVLQQDAFLKLQVFDVFILLLGCMLGTLAAFPAAISAARTDIARLLVRG